MNGDYKTNKRDLEDMNDSSTANKKARLDEAGPSKVVHLRNLPTNIIPAELIALGAAFGRVDKHFFIKDKTQALLQLGSVEEAQTMVEHYTTNKSQLNGRDIYVQFSRRQEITINGVHQSSAPLDAASTPAAPNLVLPYGTAIKSDAEVSPIATSYNTIIRVIHENATYPQDLDSMYNIVSKFGKILKIVTFHKNNQQGALVQYSSNKEASMAIAGIHHKSLLDGSYMRAEVSKLAQLEVRENGKRSWDFTKDPKLPTASMPQQTFTMPYAALGVYGNVLRVKILFNKKGTALIQMADPCQVRLAIQYLDRLPLYGMQMRVNESKNTQVHLPRPGDSPEASQLTKDYSTSPLHRFKKPGSKNYLNIFPPSAVLHLSNIPQDCTEETLREAIHSVGGILNIVAFKFLISDKKMALVQLDSVQEAAQSLIRLHNYKLSDTNHLRVSFSKAVI